MLAAPGASPPRPHLFCVTPYTRLSQSVASPLLGLKANVLQPARVTVPAAVATTRRSCPLHVPHTGISQHALSPGPSPQNSAHQTGSPGCSLPRLATRSGHLCATTILVATMRTEVIVATHCSMTVNQSRCCKTLLQWWFDHNVATVSSDHITATMTENRCFPW
jgi:hypothetical protein